MSPLEDSWPRSCLYGLFLWSRVQCLLDGFLLWQHHIQELTQKKGKFGDISLEAEVTCLTGDTLPGTGLRA